MVASSSAGPLSVEVLSSQSLLAMARDPTLPEPLTVDKFVLGDVRPTSPSSPRFGCSSPAGGRSAPPSPPVMRMGLPPAPASDDGRTGVVDAAVNTARTLNDEFEEYESGELDSDSSDSFTWHA